jgi:hypothetical protein
MIGYGRPTTICMMVRFFSRKLKQIVKSLCDGAFADLAGSEQINLFHRLDIDPTKSYNQNRMNSNRSYLSQQWAWRWPWRQFAFQVP